MTCNSRCELVYLNSNRSVHRIEMLLIHEKLTYWSMRMIVKYLGMLSMNPKRIIATKVCRIVFRNVLKVIRGGCQLLTKCKK